MLFNINMPAKFTVMLSGVALILGISVTSVFAVSNSTQAVCSARERIVAQRFKSINNLVEVMTQKFDGIQTRVDNYYSSVLLPKGVTVQNIDALKLDISVKKAAVTEALAKVRVDETDFQCASRDEAKLQIKTFKDDTKKVKQTLFDYRKSIRNLIVAVATASAGAEKAATGSANQNKEGRICAQVVTRGCSIANPALCRDFPTPCDMPPDWRTVSQ